MGIDSVRVYGLLDLGQLHPDVAEVAVVAVDLLYFAVAVGCLPNTLLPIS